MDLKQALGNRVSTLRKERGYTQQQFAEKIDRSVDGLSLIERGETWPSVITIEAMSDALSLEPVDLFDGLRLGARKHESDAFTKASDILRQLSQQDLLVAVGLLEALQSRDDSERD
ncbi:helix-turn-helix domain-containing protein [Anderseniella sp. Alg231-50]|uniref:helix-turn-helix domain-containing protein n=1 Tax=Anderseniella sp. Alg231-50 TaxID=1922226 RepID=UPI000D54D481